MARFRNDTGSVLHSQEFGLIPPGEFEAHGYDPEAHGVIPGCTWLDAPEPEAEGDGTEGSATDVEAADPKAPSKRAPKAANREKEGGQ